MRSIFLLTFLLGSIANAHAVSYTNDVLTILNQNCVMCHIPGAAQADLNLYPDAWSQLVGISSNQSSLPLVEPGYPDKSYLYLKLIGTQETVEGSCLQMPFQQGPLAPAQIEAFRLWIEQGAKQN